MTILVGYMLKYDCYNAYTYKNNKLVYDWKKDGRFKLYAKYKGKEDSIPKSELSDFQYQRALYQTMLDRFISKGFQITDENGIRRTLNKNDDLPQAFTDLEISGIKQEADMLFGYMDNDNKAELFKQGMFNMIGHFKT